MKKTQCRHCHPIELVDTDASVLVADGGQESLNTVLDNIEERVVPCTTAVCPNCNHISILSSGTVDSLLCTVVMWRRLKEWIDEVGVVKDDNGADIY